MEQRQLQMNSLFNIYFHLLKQKGIKSEKFSTSQIFRSYFSDLSEDILL